MTRCTFGRARAGPTCLCSGTFLPRRRDRCCGFHPRRRGICSPSHMCDRRRYARRVSRRNSHQLCELAGAAAQTDVPIGRGGAGERETVGRMLTDDGRGGDSSGETPVERKNLVGFADVIHRGTGGGRGEGAPVGARHRST